MAFEVGQEVQPVVNYTVSGLEFNTSEIPGTVRARELTSTIGDVSYYDYQVLMSEDIVSESGSISEALIWFNDEELGGEGIPVTPITDIGNVNDLLNSARVGADGAVSTITDINNQLSPGSRYDGEIESALSETTAIQSTLNSYTVPTEEEQEDGNFTAQTITRDSNYIGNDALLLEEWAETLAGFDSVLYDLDSERVAQEEQDSIQGLAAFEDDVLNRQAFNQSYVNNEGSQALLTPKQTEQDQATITDPASLIPEEDLNDPGNIISDVPALDLEQDE